MILKFNKKIYKKSALNRAVKDYSSLASFSFSQDELYFFVKIINPQPQLKNIISNEFINYVDSLMVI